MKLGISLDEYISRLVARDLSGTATQTSVEAEAMSKRRLADA